MGIWLARKMTFIRSKWHRPLAFKIILLEKEESVGGDHLCPSAQVWRPLLAPRRITVGGRLRDGWNELLAFTNCRRGLL